MRTPVETIIHAARIIKGARVMTNSRFRRNFTGQEISPIPILIKHGIVKKLDCSTTHVTESRRAGNTAWPIVAYGSFDLRGISTRDRILAAIGHPNMWVASKEDAE